jgi:hypothetical protein
MTIQGLLREQGFSAKNYAYSRKLDYDTFKQVAAGVYAGRRRGKARECIEALYRDGLLPPHHPMYTKLCELDLEAV